MENSTIKLLNSFDESITELDISHKNIKGILDLEKFYYLKKLICSKNQITQITNITNIIKYLDCSYNQIEELTFRILCSDLNYLNCKKNKITKLYYPFDLKPKSYPKTLKELKFGYVFNQPIDNLPNGLIILYLSDNFNFPIDNLPIGLKDLTLGNKFNHPIDNLPESLDSLILGYEFNHPINNLPNSLTKLTIGNNFNFPINNLPKNITYLILNNEINYPIDNLPDGLETLRFGKKLEHMVENLPLSITDLTLDNMIILPKVKIPKNTLRLEIETNYNYNPEIQVENFKYILGSTNSLNLQEISFGDYFDSSGMTNFKGEMTKSDNKYKFDFSVYWEFLTELLNSFTDSVFDKNNSSINLLIGTFNEEIYEPSNRFIKEIIEQKCLHMDDYQISKYIKKNIKSIKTQYQNIIKEYCISLCPNQNLSIKFIYHNVN